MDKNSGEERPKTVQHCDVVKLQQKGGDPDGKQRIKEDFGHAFEFIRTKATWRSESCDCKRHLENCGKRTAPFPDRIRRWFYCEQQYSKQRVSERKNGITKQQPEAK